MGLERDDKGSGKGDPAVPQEPLGSRVLRLPDVTYYRGSDYSDEARRDHSGPIIELLTALHRDNTDRADHPVVAVFSGDKVRGPDEFSREGFYTRSLARALVEDGQSVGLKIEATAHDGSVWDQPSPTPEQPKRRRLRLRKPEPATTPQQSPPDFRLKIEVKNDLQGATQDPQTLTPRYSRVLTTVSIIH